MAACQIRERDWCNVLTAHVDEPCAYTWRLYNYVIGEHALRPPGKANGSVTAVAIRACGTVGLVATSTGRLDRFNLQSGLHRGNFVDGNLGI